MKPMVLLAPLALLFAGCATTHKPTPEETAPLKVVKADAAMPFANLHHQIDDWVVRKDGSLLIRGAGGRWYHATFFGPCVGLDFETRIGFEPNATGELDKFSGIRFGHQTCKFDTFDEVANPRAPAAPAAPPPA
jgi:hypothetical protein